MPAVVILEGGEQCVGIDRNVCEICVALCRGGVK